MKRTWCGGVLSSGGVLLLLAGAGLWLGAASLVSGAGNGLMAVSPASMNVPVGGEDFTIDVTLDDVENLGGYELTMTFDPDVLEYVNAADSDFVASTGRTHICVSPGPAATVNERGALNLNCNTNGLIQGGSGTAGPNANGDVIARAIFRPKGVGVSDLRIRAWDPHGSEPVYKLGEYVNSKNETVDVLGRSSAFRVETCSGSVCEEGIGVDIGVQNSVVKVFDPNAPTPTGVPATPTRIPAAPKQDIQATVQAVLGTPGRRLATPVPGSSGASGGSVAGTTRGGQRLPVGSTQGSRATGPDGAPVAGYGPQDSNTATWPRATGLALGVLGLVAFGAGTAMRRRNN